MPRDTYEHQSNNEGVPAWGVVDTLGYKGRLYLANEAGTQGVVLLSYPLRPGLTGIAWWDGAWDPSLIKANIKWCCSPLALLAWASSHRIASQFGALLYLLTLDVQRKSN